MKEMVVEAGFKLTEMLEDCICDLVDKHTVGDNGVYFILSYTILSEFVDVEAYVNGEYTESVRVDYPKFVIKES